MNYLLHNFITRNILLEELHTNCRWTIPFVHGCMNDIGWMRKLFWVNDIKANYCYMTHRPNDQHLSPWSYLTLTSDILQNDRCGYLSHPLHFDMSSTGLSTYYQSNPHPYPLTVMGVGDSLSMEDHCPWLISQLRQPFKGKCLETLSILLASHKGPVMQICDRMDKV